MSGEALGSARALWVLARPAMLPYLWLLVLVGYGWGHWDRALTFRGERSLVLVLAAWTALHAGTLWLNAALDQDEGDVLFGEQAPVPAWIHGPAYAALALTVLLTAAAGWCAGIAGLVVATLAVLYSHPITRWKSHPVLGPATNLIGYGLLSPLVGWSVVGVGPNPRTLAMWLLGAVGVLGVYFLAQVFQHDEDAARGYRTLVVTHGPATTLAVAHACVAVAFVGGTVLAAVGWLPLCCLVALPLGLWNSHGLVRWSRSLATADGGWARRAARRLLISGLVGLGAVLALYSYQTWRQDVPVAGLGTARGLPPDRPAWPPAAMHAWGLAHPDPEDGLCSP